MCNLSWTPHSNLEKDNSLKTTPVLAQRWAVWSLLTKKLESLREILSNKYYNINQTVTVSMRMEEVNRMFEIRLDHWRNMIMAEELNMHYSSVFTREDTCSLPVPETKFNGPGGKV